MNFCPTWKIRRAVDLIEGKLLLAIWLCRVAAMCCICVVLGADFLGAMQFDCCWIFGCRIFRFTVVVEPFLLHGSICRGCCIFVAVQDRFLVAWTTAYPAAAARCGERWRQGKRRKQDLNSLSYFQFPICCLLLNLQINPTFVYYLQGLCGPKLITPHFRTRLALTWN